MRRDRRQDGGGQGWPGADGGRTVVARMARGRTVVARAGQDGHLHSAGLGSARAVRKSWGGWRPGLAKAGRVLGPLHRASLGFGSRLLSHVHLAANWREVPMGGGRRCGSCWLQRHLPASPAPWEAAQPQLAFWPCLPCPPLPSPAMLSLLHALRSTPDSSRSAQHISFWDVPGPVALPLSCFIALAPGGRVRHLPSHLGVARCLCHAPGLQAWAAPRLCFKLCTVCSGLAGLGTGVPSGHLHLPLAGDPEHGTSGYSGGCFLGPTVCSSAQVTSSRRGLAGASRPWLRDWVPSHSPSRGAAREAPSVSLHRSCLQRCLAPVQVPGLRG